ncbi:hypothetical protein LOK49_LG12G03028 [Camellia lanceoleosa]|uniref:Uncharacterized protein n=1 Tax=Camellia lanceoleosa TaxID=1840588 RepID=A0ACC0FQ55_9ERIC|nr:hypothetical protein LOK49_LG12G03028 [Camellia lanceoleosa]
MAKELLGMSQERVHGQDNGLSISTKHCTVEESGAIEAVLVNTNQFYKWFTDLEAAMKSETEEKYQHYLTSLTERIQTCDGILHQVDETPICLMNYTCKDQQRQQRPKLFMMYVIDWYGPLSIHFALILHSIRLPVAIVVNFDLIKCSFKVATNFYSPNMNVANGNFLPLLKRLDECISKEEVVADRPLLQKEELKMGEAKMGVFTAEQCLSSTQPTGSGTGIEVRKVGTVVWHLSALFANVSGHLLFASFELYRHDQCKQAGISIVPPMLYGSCIIGSKTNVLGHSFVFRF